MEANLLEVGARGSGPNKAVTEVVEWQRLLGARNHTSYDKNFEDRLQW